MFEENPVTPRESKADARIAIDDRLRQAGWDPLDKSAVRTEVSAASSSRPSGLVARSRARPYETHAPVYELVAAAGSFGPDRTVGTVADELGWLPVPGQVRLTRARSVAQVSGRASGPGRPDGP